MTSARTKLAGAVLTLVAVSAAVAAGCGDDVPDDAVARVGDSVIEREDFENQLRAIRGRIPGGQASSPDPPDFERCVAAKQSQAPPGAPKPSAEQLKNQCKQEYDQLKSSAMVSLIQAEWVEQEAEAQDVKVSDQEVRKSLEAQKAAAFRGKKGEKRYQDFLKRSGMTEEQFLSRLRLQTLQQRLTQKVTEKESKRVVTDAEAKDYYDKNKSSLALPVRRDVNVVLAQTKRRADQAKKALEGGQSLKRVAEKYSIDAASKAQGGRLRDVAKGQHEKAFDEAVFSARKGELEGPVKTRLGYYVFEVTKVSSASQPTFDKSKERIENLLRSQRQQKAIEGFREDLRERYREKTICADEFVVAECDNGPEAKTNTGRAPGSTPQSPQPVPPGGGAPQRRTPQAPPPRPQSP